MSIFFPKAGLDSKRPVRYTLGMAPRRVRKIPQTFVDRFGLETARALEGLRLTLSARDTPVSPQDTATLLSVLSPYLPHFGAACAALQDSEDA